MPSTKRVKRNPFQKAYVNHVIGEPIKTYKSALRRKKRAHKWAPTPKQEQAAARKQLRKKKRELLKAQKLLLKGKEYLAKKGPDGWTKGTFKDEWTGAVCAVGALREFDKSYDVVLNQAGVEDDRIIRANDDSKTIFSQVVAGLAWLARRLGPDIKALDKALRLKAK